MQFLGDKVWPLMKDHAYCSDSYSCLDYKSSHVFPIARSQLWEHVGQVFDGEGVPRQSDVDLLKATPLKLDCIPGK